MTPIPILTAVQEDDTGQIQHIITPHTDNQPIMVILLIAGPTDTSMKEIMTDTINLQNQCIPAVPAHLNTDMTNMTCTIIKYLMLNICMAI